MICSISSKIHLYPKLIILSNINLKFIPFNTFNFGKFIKTLLEAHTISKIVPKALNSKMLAVK